MDDLLREFVGESLDMIEAVASDLVAWEAEPENRSGLDQIFRTVHTIKGSSGFFNLPRVTEIAHATEELLSVLRARRGNPDDATVALVLQAFDQIKALIHGIAQSGSEAAGDDRTLIAALTSKVRGQDRTEMASGETDASASAPMSDAAPAEDVSTRTIPAEWRSVRVPVSLLDALMSGVSDLVLARNELAAALRAAGTDVDNLAAFDRLSLLLGGVRGAVSQMRMVPLRQLFAPLPRLVRQVAGELNKHVRLESDGGEVEIDREVIEALRDPIVHVLRNAIDHGIEPEQDRLAAGKPAFATISISGRQVGNRIHICISDDGAGLAEQSLIDRAIAAGHLTRDKASGLCPADIAELVFLPGLSTAREVTGISGRGVGMDVVRANVEHLGGLIRIASTAGAGVTITFDVPMTLTIISALAISAGGQEYAVPRTAVEEVLLCSSHAVQRVDVGGASMVRVRGRLYPHVILEHILDVAQDDNDDKDDRALVLCRLTGGSALALEVPDVRDHAELVIKPLPPVMLAAGIYNGFSLPDTGRPMLLLDVDGISRLTGAVLAKAEDEAIGAHDDDEQVAVQSGQWLCFERYDCEGIAALPMDRIERLIDVQVGDLRQIGTARVAVLGEQLIPVVDVGMTFDSADPALRMICIGQAERLLLLPIRNVLHMAQLVPDEASSTYCMAQGRNELVGVTMFNGEIVELWDVDALFQAKLPVAGQRQPLQMTDARAIWLIAGPADDRIVRLFKPSLETAGYAVHVVAGPDELPADAEFAITADAAGGAEPASSTDAAAMSPEWVILRHGQHLHRIQPEAATSLLTGLISSDETGLAGRAGRAGGR